MSDIFPEVWSRYQVPGHQDDVIAIFIFTAPVSDNAIIVSAVHVDLQVCSTLRWVGRFNTQVWQW
ncbi:hypothetical protein B6E78_00250 [Edwardsiella ictaluri]|nr:hypothetical protein B6E78_00250 [Edwardsiella ictaluri]